MAHPTYIRNILREAPARWFDEPTKRNLTRSQIFIKCPVHANGNERTASLAVYIDKHRGFMPGDSRCMACNRKFKWDQLFKYLTGKEAVDHESDDYTINFFANDVETDDIDNDQKELTSYNNMLPWPIKENWRGISGELVNIVGGRIMLYTFPDSKDQIQNLYLPVFVNNHLYGGVRCNIIKSGKRNYFNTPGIWSLHHGIFPYDYATKMIKVKNYSCLVLVEGPRDALNCIQHDIPAVCLLGASAWSENKADLVLNTGVKTIITAFDPDEAGDKLTANVYDSLKHEINVKRFSFPKNEEKIDPGNMSNYLDILKRFKQVTSLYREAVSNPMESTYVGN